MIQLDIYCPYLRRTLFSEQSLLERLPNFMRLLHYARPQQGGVGHDEANLLQLFALPPGQGLAPLRAYGDNCDVSQGYWYCLDPINLLLDRQTAFVTAADTLTCSTQQLADLQTQLQSLVAPYQANMILAHPERWYLQLDQAWDISTVNLSQALNRPMTTLQPRGDDALKWQSLLTEIQLVLHQQQTISQLAVNSVWLWGGGQLPKNKAADFTAVFSNNILVQGMAKYGDVTCYEMKDNFTRFSKQCDFPGKYLIVLQDLFTENEDMMEDTLLDLENNFWLSLATWLKQSKLHQCRLHLGGGTTWQLAAKPWWRWWPTLTLKQLQEHYGR